MSFNNCSLYLCPVASNFIVADLFSFINQLKTIELIAEPLKDKAKNNAKDETHFYVGDKYLSYIAYMGCSPSIQFAAGETNEKFCHIKIQQFNTARLIHNKIQNKAPHCPHCQQRIKNWQLKDEPLKNGQQNSSDSHIHCDSCNTTVAMEKFNWRKNGAYARLFIEITDIFPKEALPQQTLLDKLALLSHTDWQYFYSCQ
jgi:hypothetical protein